MYTESDILPSFLEVSHNGQQLDNQDTIESASILAGDIVVCQEIGQDLTNEDGDEEVGQERGFGGTALTGRRSESEALSYTLSHGTPGQIADLDQAVRTVHSKTRLRPKSARYATEWVLSD